MTDIVVLLSTCASPEEATRIAAILVTERLAACVNILPGLHSIYRWQGKVESASEVLLFLKTTLSRAPALHERLIELHSYDTPEVLVLPVLEGAEKYLTWVREQV